MLWSSKQTYFMFLESNAILKQKKYIRIDEQLELLRATISNLCFVSTSLKTRI